MVTYSIAVDEIDHEALASEVLSSAARVLLLAGLSESEVSNRFLEVSGQLSSHANDIEIEAIELEDMTDDEGFDLWDLRDEYEQIEPVKALNRLAKRASALEDLEGGQHVQKMEMIVSEAIKHRIEALTWLREKADRLGVEFHSCNETWIQNASDDDLDKEDDVIFLDDYNWSTNFSWYLVGQLARNMARAGDKNGLALLCQKVLRDEVALEKNVRDTVSESLEIVDQYEEFRSYVLRHAGSGELPQAEFINKYLQSHGYHEESFALYSWLEALAEEGVIERYKRSNRWRLVVL